jgi:hypothetical protein
VTLEKISGKKGEEVRTGLSWLRIGTRGWDFCEHGSSVSIKGGEEFLD